MTDALARLVAESDIRRVLTRYCRGIDRLDEDLVRSCYHEGATDEHGTFSGSAEEFITWAFRLLRRFDVTMHFLGNVAIELAGPDVALVETYAIAVHRRSGGAPTDNLLTGFRYVDRFEHRALPDGGALEWRIAHRVVVTEWLRVDDESQWFSIGDGIRRGLRDRGDIIYTLLQE